MKHHGSDGWCMDRVSLEFRMGGIVECEAGVVLDGAGFFLGLGWLL